MNQNISEIISYLFGAGSIGYMIISHFLRKKKYNQEVKNEEICAEIKQDEFWENRYNVLKKEYNDKDTWWKNRYDSIYSEYLKERELNNEMVKSFRLELNEMREDYEQQRELEKKKYDNLMTQYRNFEKEIQDREKEYKNRITTLEQMVDSYEQRLNNDGK